MYVPQTAGRPLPSLLSLSFFYAVMWCRLRHYSELKFEIFKLWNDFDQFFLRKRRSATRFEACLLQSAAYLATVSRCLVAKSCSCPWPAAVGSPTRCCTVTPVVYDIFSDQYIFAQTSFTYFAGELVMMIHADYSNRGDDRRTWIRI